MVGTGTWRRRAGRAVVMATLVTGCSSAGPPSGGASGGAPAGGHSGSGGIGSGGAANGASGGSHGTGGAPNSASGGRVGSGGGGANSATGGSVGSGGITGFGGGSPTGGAGQAPGAGGTAGGPSGAAGGAGGAGGAAANATGGAAGMNCPPLGSQIDIPAATVSGAVTVNGGRVSDADPSTGWISLVRSSAAGVAVDQGALASVSPAGSAYAALVVPGVYDVVYTASSAGTGPVNSKAVLRSGVVIGTAPMTLNVDVPATTVTLSASVNGKPMTAAAPFRQGGLALVNAAGDNALLTGNAAAKGAYAALVVPGVYDLVYAGDELGAGMPINGAAVLQSGIVVGTAGVSLQVDVPATKVAISVTVNGAAVSLPTAAIIDLSLRTPAGDVAQLVPASSTSNTLSALVVPGTYDLYYAIGSAADSNSHASRIRSGIVVGTSPLSMGVDVAETPVTCTATLDGMAIPGAAVGLRLQGPAGELFPLTTDTQSTLVIPGTYDLVYQGSGAFGSGLPMNASTPLRTGIVIDTAPVALAVDLPAVNLMGAVTLNGAALDRQAMGQGFLTLVSAAGGSSIIGTLSPSYSTIVLAGTYDLYYRMFEEGVDVPENTMALVKKGVVVGPPPSPMTLDIDVHAVALPTATTLNGSPITDPSGNARGVLQLYGATGDVASFATVSARPDTLPPALVIPGTYDLYYRVYDDGPAIPINSHGYLGCVTVP